jgi:hypothetical protein
LVQAVLHKAGKNRKQLVKVINHYSQNPADSLKLRAAYFLIGNMPDHRYEEYPAIFNTVFDSAATISNWKKRVRYVQSAMIHIRRERPEVFYRDSTFTDLKQVTAHFLIQNINLAFKAKQQMPKKFRPNFQKFLRYVLPYRAGSEPLNFGNRAWQFKKYQWVYGKLRSGSSLWGLINAVMDSMEINIYVSNSYPELLSAKQIERAGFGNCVEKSTYAVNVFRAIGIPASIDFTPHWGNSPKGGHSWIAIHTRDSVIAINPFSRWRVTKQYRRSSAPKIYCRTFQRRNTYPPFTKDVTTAYKPPNQISIANRWGKDLNDQTVYLTVFDRNRLWVPVAKATGIKDELVTFNNIGTHIVYMTGYYSRSHTFHPLNYPFIVNSRQQITYLNPTRGGRIGSAILLRKYPPFIMPSKRKLHWVKKLNTLKLQGSNARSFITHHTILSIHHFNSTHIQTIPLSYQGKYKYYRLIGPDSTPVWLATLRLVSEHNHEQIYHYRKKTKHTNYKNWLTIKAESEPFSALTDNNPLTFWGGKSLYILYNFSRPVKINALKIQPRNDDNHIDIGDRYELLYWNRGWQSLGMKTATDTMLVYHNLPKDALYWLRDRTKGNEEEVFTITQGGRQWWLGVSNFIK